MVVPAIKLGNRAGRVFEPGEDFLIVDNLAVERFPSSNPENFVPVHSYLLVERGVSIIEALWLEDLSKDGVYEFLFIASPLKFKGGTASPIRPLAIALQH